MKRVSILIAAMLFTFSGCGIYNKYTPQTEISSDAYGTSEDVEAAAADNSIAELSWREFFTDPALQNLIDSVLVRNTDLNSARIAVEQSQASLRAAKLGYLPSISFAHQDQCRVSTSALQRGHTICPCKLIGISTSLLSTPTRNVRLRLLCGRLRHANRLLCPT